MRKVTLAWPASRIEYLDAGEQDETIEVEDHVASRLLGDGLAREPATSQLTVAELEAAAAAKGVDLSAAKTKADKQAALDAASTGEGN